MSSADLSSVLDDCLKQLRSGETLEQVLARYPLEAVELKSLLETASVLQTSRTQVEIPVQSQARSRIAFINSTNQPVQVHSLFHSFHLRFATAFIIILVLFGFGLLGTTLASAHTLPGDTFYPVKLALEQVQLNFTTGSVQRLQLEQEMDERRTSEVTELKQAGRQSLVSFTGELVRNGDQWQVAGITLDLNSEQEAKAAQLENYIVQVSGDLEGMTVHVSDIRMHMLTFNGKIQQIRSDSWLVDGVEFFLDNNTDIAGNATVGSSVQITARRDKNGQILALTVDVTTSGFVLETSDPTGEAHEETLASTATGGSESHQGSDDNSNPPGGDHNPENTPQPSSTSGSDGGEHQSTATGAVTATPSPTRSYQGGDDGEGPTRTRVSTQKVTITPSLTPTMTPSSTKLNSEGTQSSGEHSRPTRTPTPTKRS